MRCNHLQISTLYPRSRRKYPTTSTALVLDFREMPSRQLYVRIEINEQSLFELPNLRLRCLVPAFLAPQQGGLFHIYPTTQIIG